MPPASHACSHAADTDTDRSLADVVEGLAATVAEDSSAEDVLRQLAEAAVHVLRVDGAGVMLARRGSPAAVLLIDIDHFKAVNDVHGHLVGDDVLRGVAAGLRAQLRDGDLLGRFGGEEFAALLPGMDAGEAAQAAERLRAGVAAVVTPVDGAVVQVTVSLGVSVADPAVPAAPDLSELLAAADAALYRAKGSGRDRVGMQVRADRRAPS